MSFQKIESAIKTAKQITHWNFHLIEYNHKKYPNEYVCYNVNFASAQLLNDIITSMCDTFLDVVKKQNHILEYTAQNPKNTTEKLDVTNELMQLSWPSLVEHINNSDDSVDLKNISANAFVFVGNYEDTDGNSKNLYLLTQKNPVLSFKKRTPIFSARNNTITETTEPLVQFGKCFNILIVDNILYSINNNFESIFNIEYSHKIVCRERLQDLETADIVDDIESYKTFASSGQNPKKFITYNPEIVEKLKKQEYKDLLKNYLHIPVNPTTDKFDLSDIKNAKNFTLAICDKAKNNMFDDGVCEVPSSSPISFT